MNYFTAPGSPVPPSPLEILRRTFRIYAISICPIILVSLVTIPPAQALIYVARRYIVKHPQYDPDDVSYLFLFALVILWVGVFFRSFASAAFVQVAINAHAETGSRFNDVVEASRGHACKVFLEICISLILATVGLGLLVAPGIYLLLSWMVAVPAIVVEKRGVIGGMKRSWDLTSGERYRLLVLWLYFGLAIFVLALAAGFLLAPVVGSNRYLVQLVVYGVGVVTFLPLQNILQVVLYFDIRARRESYDIARLLGELRSNDVGNVNQPAATVATTSEDEDEGGYHLLLENDVGNVNEPAAAGATEGENHLLLEAQQGPPQDPAHFDRSKPAWANTEFV